MIKQFGLLTIIFFNILMWILFIQFIQQYNKKEQNYFYDKIKKKIKNSNYEFLINNQDKKKSNFVYATNKSIDAIVHIKNYCNTNEIILDPFSEDLFNYKIHKFNVKNNDFTLYGTGSGIILSPNGYIITNNHVIDKSSKLEVILNNGKSCLAKIIGQDINTDIAVIKINKINLPFLKFENSEKIKIGEWVLAIGNPFGLASSVTAGIISGKQRVLNMIRSDSKSPIESFLQTDAVINPGSSGGALLNISGNLIGINTALSSPTGTYIGYGFAIPSTLAQKIVKDIQQFGSVKRGFLGIYTLDLTNDQQIMQYNQHHKLKISSQEGIMITNLINKKANSYKGLKIKDIIIKIDEYKIKSYGDLCLALGNKNPGDIVKIEILRDNKKKIYNIILNDPQENMTREIAQKYNIMKFLGANFEMLTLQQKINFGLKNGLFIKKIQNKKFNIIGFEEGGILIKINKKFINSYTDLLYLLKNYKKFTYIEYLDPYGRLIKKNRIIE